MTALSASGQDRLAAGAAMTEPRRGVALLAGLGVAGVAASLALFAMLHVVPPSGGLDWSRRTISQYALLDNGWAFDAATLLLAAGSLAVLAALVRARLLRPASGAAVSDTVSSCIR